MTYVNIHHFSNVIVKKITFGLIVFTLSFFYKNNIHSNNSNNNSNHIIRNSNNNINNSNNNISNNNINNNKSNLSNISNINNSNIIINNSNHNDHNIHNNSMEGIEDVRQLHYLSSVMKAILTIVATKIALKIILATFCTTYVVRGNKREARRISKEIYGIDPDGDWMGRLEIHEAAATGNVKKLELLLNQGSAADAYAWDQTTPLHEASYAGELSCVLLLIKFGATINTHTNDGATPLSLAAAQGHFYVLDALLQYGAKVNPGEGITERYKLALIKPPVHEAVARGHLDCVRLLLEADGDPNFQDGALGLPLCVAVKNGAGEAARLLLGHGADPGSAAAAAAARRNLTTGCPFFCMTPLHLAAKHNHADLVMLLLECGADSDAVNGEGKKPRDLCGVQGDTVQQVTQEEEEEEGVEEEDIDEGKKCFKVFQFYEMHPKRLTSLCRLCVNKSLGRNKIKALRKLNNLPKTLKDFLVHKY